MKNWKSIAAICLVFVLGAAAGGLIAARVLTKRFQHIMQGGPQAVNEIIVKRLAHKLDLDAAQRDKLKNIVTETREKIKTARSQIAPQVKEILSGSVREIRGMLKPEQGKKFDEVIEKNKARMEHFE